MSDVLDKKPAIVESSGLPFEPLPSFTGVLRDEATLAQNHGKRIGILIVTYNALTTLTKVLKRITPEVWDNVEEIAVFDDASQDATYELAMGLKALRSLPKLTILKHSQNLGYGGNQKAGYRYFIERGFDVVVLLHGDGQYAPEIVSHMYHDLVMGNADAVFGSRMMKDFGGPLKGGMPLYKYIGNRILSAFENRAMGLNLTEWHSGYRAYSLRALRNIDFTHMTDDFHFDSEIIIKMTHQHYRIKEVPIPTFYGDEICYVNGVKYAADVFRTVRRYKLSANSIQSFPEFQEYFVRYPIKQAKYSSHYYARQMVGRNHEALEIGCGDGSFATELVKEGNVVTGVDEGPPPENASLADYYRVRLNDGLESVIERLNGKRFDRILLLDILEHLQNPELVLKQCRELVKDDGEVIVSVPNVAHISVRLMLLFGRFQYAERGILDRGHQRFYTRRTARQMFFDAGYRIVEEYTTVTPIELLFGLSRSGILFKTLNGLLAGVTRMMPGLFGYQVMLAGRRDKAA